MALGTWGQLQLPPSCWVHLLDFYQVPFDPAISITETRHLTASGAAPAGMHDLVSRDFPALGAFGLISRSSCIRVSVSQFCTLYYAG